MNEDLMANNLNFQKLAGDGEAKLPNVQWPAKLAGDVMKYAF